MELQNTKRTNKFRFFIIVLALFLSFGLISCGQEENIDKYNDTNDYSNFPKEFIGYIKDKNIYFTSIGQSYEYDSMNVLMRNSFKSVNYESNNLLESSTVPSGSVVFLYIGGSVKTLTELDLTIESETKRLNDFINRKLNNEINLICVHLGGIKRRGSTSDSLIELGFSNSNLNVYVSDGNYDYFLSSLSSSNHIPCTSILKLAEMKKIISFLLGEVVL